MSILELQEPTQGIFAYIYFEVDVHKN